MIQFFNPKKRQLNVVRSWFIKPHRVRAIWKKYIREDSNGQQCSGLELADSKDIGKEETFPICEKCKKVFEYYDLAFYCTTSPVRIVGYACYGKVCFSCGLLMLAEITPQEQLPQLKKMELEYKGA